MAATTTAAINQVSIRSFKAARRPTAHINHTHIKDANNPAVNARSTTTGTQTKEAMSHTLITTSHLRSRRGQGDLIKGISTTRSNAQAANIQLNNKGITAVEGLLAKGFNQGSATQAANSPRVQDVWC
jgi:hypothetical protein